MWKTQQRNIRKHLPIDEITHRVLPFLENRTSLPLLNAHLVPTLLLPALDPPAHSFTTLKKQSRTILLLQWQFLASPPSGYPYPHSLAPHLFMGLSKFLAGRIHQVRAGKSYLAAHPSWFNKDSAPLCPRCHASPETFKHTLLHCGACRIQRGRFLPAITSVDESSPIWSTNDSVVALSNYINLNATTTGFPSDMFPTSPAPSSTPPSPDFTPSARPRFSSVEDD